MSERLECIDWRGWPDWLEWVKLSEAAADAFAGLASADAQEKWKRAHELAAGCETGAPFRAASLNNAGLAHLFAADKPLAKIHFEQALDAWSKVRLWIEDMSLAGSARSSLFHFRMEQTHRKQYEHHRRQKLQSLVDSAIATVTSNLEDLPDSRADMTKRQITSRSDPSVDFIWLARSQRWVVEKPPMLTDEGALMAAILLMRGIRATMPLPAHSAS